MAGEDLEVRVGGLAAGGAARLLVGTALGQRSVAVSGDEDGEAVVVLDADLTRAAGELTVHARSAGGTTRGATTITPDAVVDPVVTVVGARTIVADGADLAMAVAIPVDRWGNAPVDGTPALVTRVRPGGEVEDQTVQVDGLLTWAELFSGTDAGTNRVWTSLGPRTGTATSLVEVPAPPAGLRLRPDPEVAPADPVADGRSLLGVRTGRLRDAFGNVQLDGTSVSVRWRGPDGRGAATTQTLGGVARLVLQAPSRPGVLVLRAQSRGVRSAPLRIEVAPALERLPVSASPSGDGFVRVAVGPVLGTSGALLDDGTPVRVVVRTDDGPVAVTGRLRDGRADLEVPVGDRVPRRAEARVLGVAASVRVRGVAP